MDTADIIKYGITFGSAAVALWQIKSRYNIQKYLRQESFNLHSSVALVLGNSQRAIDNMIKNNQTQALADAGQVEGGTQMLLKQTVKIICHYTNPTDADVCDWIKRGKINKDYKAMFLAHSEVNRGCLRAILRTIKDKSF